MAFSATTVWECQSGGDDATTGNGGSFDVGNANFATDLTTDTNTGNTASPVVSSASYNFAAGDVGHWVFIKAGTNWNKGWFKIASVASNKATVDGTSGAWIDYNTLSPGTSTGIATVGTPTSGTWGVDYSQTTSSRLTFTDMVIDPTTNTDFTSVGNPVGVNMLGNTIAVSSGTGFTVQRVQINSIPTALTARVDKSLGTLGSTGGNGKLGGCLASPGMIGGLFVASNWAFIKQANYTISSSNNVSGGRITCSAVGSSTAPNLWIGYNALRGDANLATSTKPVLKANASSMNVFVASGQCTVCHNIDMGNNSAFTSVTAWSVSGGAARVYNSKVLSLATGFSMSGTGNGVIYCTAESAATGFTWSNNGHMHGCTALSCTTGFVLSAAVIANHCLSTEHTTGFSLNSSNSPACFNCTAYSTVASSKGFTLTSGVRNCTLINCLAYGHATDDFFAGATTDQSNAIINCAGATDNLAALMKINYVTLTADPFVDSGSSDFRLNQTAGGGYSCRSAGNPTSMPDYNNVANNIDIGTYQHADPTEGGLFIPVE